MGISDLTPENEHVILGGTDKTPIGNVGDRIKTDAQLSGVSIPIGAWRKYGYEDLNASTGGVARGTDIGTTFTQVYYYEGSGLLDQLLLNFEDGAKWYIRVLVDGVDVLFGSTGLYTKDLKESNRYDISDLRPVTACGLGYHDDSPRIEFTKPVIYSTSVQVLVRHESTTKKFRAGFVALSKDT